MNYRIMVLSLDGDGNPILPGAPSGDYQRDNTWTYKGKLIQNPNGPNKTYEVYATVQHHRDSDYVVFAPLANFATIDPLNTGVALAQYGKDWLLWKCKGTKLDDDGDDIEVTKTGSGKITVKADAAMSVGDVIRQGGKDATVTVDSVGKDMVVDTIAGFSAGAAKYHRLWKSNHVRRLASAPVTPPTEENPLMVDGWRVTEASHQLRLETKAGTMAPTFAADPSNMVSP